MSQTEQNSDTQPSSYTPIPSILTNSAIEILEHFQEDIIEISATASTDTTNKDELIRTHGLTRETTTQQKVTLDYRRITDSDGDVQNPMNQDNIDRIKRNLRSKLDDPSMDAKPDMSVSSFKVDVVCPQITESSRARTDEYELTFYSDPIEEDVEQRKTRSANAGKGLFTDLSFNFRNLNLRSVVETRAKYAEQSNGQIWGWGGPDDIRPNAPIPVSQAVKMNVLPEDLDAMKHYDVSEENRMKVVGMVDEEQEDNDE
jgi:hypothetical protein